MKSEEEKKKAFTALTTEQPLHEYRLDLVEGLYVVEITKNNHLN